MKSQPKRNLIIEMTPFIPITLNIARYFEAMGWNVYLSKFDFEGGQQFVEKFAKKYNFKTLNGNYDVNIERTLDLSQENVKKIIHVYRIITKLDKVNIIKKLNIEYNCYIKQIKELQISCAIVFNNLTSVLPFIAKELNLSVYFLENGYFPNTIQLDQKGVNYDSVLSNLNYDEFLELNCSYPLGPSVKGFKIEDYSLSKIEIIFSVFSEIYDTHRIYGVAYSESYIKNLIVYYKRFKLLQKKKSIKNIQENMPSNIVFIPLQVHDDTQIICNSNFKSIEDFIDICYQSVKKILPNYTMIIKEHPMDVNVDYAYLYKKYDDIIWLKDVDINALLDMSEYILVINSSVGLQGLAKYKKVIVLGNCFYTNNPFIKRAKNTEDLASELKKLKNIEYSEEDKEEIDKYINKFREIFINGGLFNFEISTLNSIYLTISSCQNK